MTIGFFMMTSSDAETARNGEAILNIGLLPFILGILFGIGATLKAVLRNIFGTHKKQGQNML